jgi:HK97 family phage major capsid protein
MSEYSTQTVVDIVKTGMADLDKKYLAYAGQVRELEGEIKSLGQSFNELAQKNSGFLMAGPRNGGSNALAKALNDDRIKAFQADRGLKSASVAINAPLSQIIERKAIVGDYPTSSDEYLTVPAQRDPRLGEVRGGRLTLIDVLPKLAVGSNALDFNQLDSYSNAAALQSVEGAPYATATIATVLKTARIATIAHYAKLSSQVVADSPLLLNQVQQLLRFGLLQKACSEIITGTSTIDGLQSLAGSYVATVGTPFSDAIGEAATELEVTGWVPDHVLMHPELWQTIRAEREASGGAYLAQTWATANARTIWGLKVITDPSVTAAAPMVFDSSQVAILDRQEARVELGRSGSDLTDGLVTVLGELRIGLAVFSPSALVKVTIATS